MTSSAQISTLLEETRWIRALARSLVGDAQLAEDLVQDAWVAALVRPPSSDRSLRGWIATLLRHRLRDMRRAHARRDERERSTARPEVQPSAHELIEKASMQRRLVAAVLELDEPYRSTVLLRFFDELPQRDIARRMGTTTATVNSRLTRALAQLRERLLREGGRTSWLQALVPLLETPSVAPAAALGISAMKTSAIVAAVAASVVVGLVMWRSSNAGSPAHEPRTSLSVPVGAQSAASPATEDAPPALAVDDRTALAVPPSTATPDVPAATLAPALVVRGRVLDANAVGVSGVALVLASQERTTALDSKALSTSGPGGWFEIPIDAPAETIVSGDPRFATVLAGSARVRGDTQPTVVVAPRVELAGVVVDEAGAPLAGAHVALRTPPAFGAEWGFALDYSVRQRWIVRCGIDGRFELRAAPALAGATLQAVLGGYQEHVESAPQHSQGTLRIVMTRPSAAEGLVRGIVLDPAGSEVEGARISAGGQVAITDRAGAFVIDVTREGTLPQLLAVKRGFLPGRFDAERDGQGAIAWPGYVVLQLGGEPATIQGRVLDADGSAIANAKVWLDDPTHFGRVTELGASAEALLAGDERFWSYVVTRTDGSFEIAGLLPRTYRVQACDPSTLASAETPPITAASSPIAITLPTREVYERIAGRVVTAEGEPVAKVAIRPYRVTFELHHENGTDNDCDEREPVITGEDGTFEFFDVPKEGVDLIASGDTILASGCQLAREKDLTNIEIVVRLRLHLQVELDEPHDRADGVRLFDAQGGRVILSVFHGGGSHASWSMPIREGRSEVIAVDSSATVAVLYRGENEVARIPLHLTRGGTNVIRF